MTRYLYFAMTNKHNTLEPANLQSLISAMGDCDFGYSPKWIESDVRQQVR